MIHRDLPEGRIPALGFGTWELEGETCIQSVERALGIGYRHVDTAVRYGNEAEVGRGIARSGLARRDVFVTTKVWHDALEYDALLGSLRDSLDRLQMDYVDLFLVHWPNPAVPLEETMSALAEARTRGWARNIGVSNFTVRHLETVCDTLRVPVVANQFELHPFLDQTRLLQATRSRGLIVEAYQPLAGGRVMRDPTLGAIAKRHGKSPAQIALKWLLDQDGVVAIPRSRNPANIAANLDLFDFELTAQDRAAIDALRGDSRFVNPAFAPQWD